ncbi:HAMP domain-containing histidine kinase [Halalkalibacterium halodurans]|uniref:HAMP domain-containing histidine kinase n=1 Tax=Halalkalibacterium halodurans TaxID=86665 RepID=UPI002E22DC74|nr:HAMP domain-containing histidine kinase [Halalkalibacterium halodurans]
MSFIQFCRDRRFYSLFYIGNTLLILLVIKLALNEEGLFISNATIGYISLLSVVSLALFLFADYIRQRPFFQELRQAKENVSLESLLKVKEGITNEQLAMIQLFGQAFEDYSTRLHTAQEQHSRSYHFANRWTHQMKTPLSVIRLILQEQDEWTKEVLVDQIEEEVGKLEDGLHMMLSTVRLQKFELDFSIERIALLSVIRSVLHGKRKTFIRYRIYPRLISEAEEVFAATDKKWLIFVLEQLIQNALKYSSTLAREPSKYITVRVEETDNGVTVSIQDEGIGIVAEDLPRVFDPFFTGENGRKLQESTGMGLYLVKQICDQLGHSITIESTVNEGTTVTLFIPPPSAYSTLLR